MKKNKRIYMIILIVLVLLAILIFRCRANAGGVAEISQNVEKNTFSVLGGVVGSVFGPIGGILGGIYGPK